MNLHGIVSGVIGSINPQVPVLVQQSNGYTTAPDGSQVPSYTELNLKGQVQALTGKDIFKLNGLNIQGVSEALYISGNVEGLFRVMGKGGDLVTFNNHTYLVVAVLERWPDWCKVALSMQLDS